MHTQCQSRSGPLQVCMIVKTTLLCEAPGVIHQDTAHLPVLGPAHVIHELIP